MPLTTSHQGAFSRNAVNSVMASAVATAMMSGQFGAGSATTASAAMVASACATP